MAKRPLIEAEQRSETGTRAMRRLRRGGRVPGVVYGGGTDNRNITVSAEKMHEVIASRSRMVELQFEGQAQPAVVKDVQYDHLGSDINHVDFERIDLEEIVRVSVPVETHGTAKGTRNGGVMEVVHRHVTVECHAGDIPNEITVEVAELDLEQSITVGQLALPEGVKVLDDPASIVVIVHPPREEEEVTAAPAEGELAEPELITRKAEEEEEEEA
jgi:large subunit ribosomal protein L25